MITPEDEKELERQMDDASLVLLLLLFTGRKNVRSQREVKFDRRRGVFVVDGKRVSVTTMRILLTQIEKIGADRAKRHVDDLAAGRITLQEWRNRMASTLKVSHWLAGSLALGGLDAARNDKSLSARTASELAYLDGFYADLKNGKMSEAKQKSRASSYFLALAITFSTIEHALKSGLIKTPTQRQLDKMAPIGVEPQYTEAKRFRRAAESCEGCRRYSGTWMPIKRMPPIGSLECRSRCRCFIVYR
jgi:hypothetical protein